MISLGDALNGWLQENWPTLYAYEVQEDYFLGRKFHTVFIRRKGSNGEVLALNIEDLYATVLYSHTASIPLLRPSDPKFLDHVNSCLLRVCKGKDLR